MTPEVISLTPSWQVITFRDYQHAKVMLLDKYHPSITNDAQELSRKYSLEQLRYMVTKTLQQDLHSAVTRNLLEVSDRNVLAQTLWPMLISQGRQVRDTAFNAKVRDAALPTHTTYYCDFTPGEDPVLDLHYIKLPPQARVLVDMFVDKIAPAGKLGIPEFLFLRYVNELKESGELVTKQPAEQIWGYYRNKLITCGMIDILKPRIGG